MSLTYTDTAQCEHSRLSLGPRLCLCGALRVLIARLLYKIPIWDDLHTPANTRETSHIFQPIHTYPRGRRSSSSINILIILTSTDHTCRKPIQAVRHSDRSRKFPASLASARKPHTCTCRAEYRRTCMHSRTLHQHCIRTGPFRRDRECIEETAGTTQASSACRPLSLLRACIQYQQSIELS